MTDPAVGLLDPAARPVIAAYLDTLSAALPLSNRARTAIAAEIADGLVESTDAQIAAGMSPDTAARAAVAEFGDPVELAAGLCTELAGQTAHHVGRWLVATGPVVGAAWVAAYAARAGVSWPKQIPAMWTAVPFLAVVLAVAAPAAVLAAASGAGWLSRRLRIDPRAAAGIAITAGIGCVAGDSALLTALALSVGTGWTALAVPAAAASLLRLTLTGVAAHRCAALRAAAR